MTRALPLRPVILRKPVDDLPEWKERQRGEDHDENAVVVPLDKDRGRLPRQPCVSGGGVTAMRVQDRRPGDNVGPAGNPLQSRDVLLRGTPGPGGAEGVPRSLGRACRLVTR